MSCVSILRGDVHLEQDEFGGFLCLPGRLSQQQSASLQIEPGSRPQRRSTFTSCGTAEFANELPLIDGTEKAKILAACSDRQQSQQSQRSPTH